MNSRETVPLLHPSGCVPRAPRPRHMDRCCLLLWEKLRERCPHPETSNSQRAHRRGVGQTGGVEPPLRRRFAGACYLFWGAGGEKLPFRGARPSARDGGKIGRSGRRRVAVRRAGEGAGRRRRGRPIPHRGGRPFRRRGESVRQRRAWARPTRTAGNRDGAPEGCAVWASSGAAGS